MKINVKFLEVEGAREAFGENKITFDLKGTSVADLVLEIMKVYGEKTEKVFSRMVVMKTTSRLS